MPDFPSNVIHEAAECTVGRYEAACFRGQLTALLREGVAPEPVLRAAFEAIHTEYVDIAGLYQTREFELLAYIDSTDKRIQSVRRFVELQRIFVAEFGLPFLPGFALAKRFGYTLYWDPTRHTTDLFLAKLAQMEGAQHKFEEKVQQKVRELVQLRAQQAAGERTIVESRHAFVTMLNRLRRERYVVERATTTVEELALMIKDQMEQRHAEEAAAQKTKRR